MEDYRIAGAADCIAAPVDIVSLNQTIQRIVRVRGRGRPVSSRAPNNFRFAGLGFYPGRNLLNGSAGNTIDLTTSEARLLTHFVSRPWALWTRSEIAELLYRPEHSVGDRAIDVVVRAAEWYRQAAEQGVATAQLRLGLLYLSDEGVVREPEGEMAWLRRAVEVGDPEAQTAVGMLALPPFYTRQRPAQHLRPPRYRHGIDHPLGAALLPNLVRPPDSTNGTPLRHVASRPDPSAAFSARIARGRSGRDKAPPSERDARGRRRMTAE